MIGAPIDRVDGHAKVTGAGLFVGDQASPGLAYGAVVLIRIEYAPAQAATSFDAHKAAAHLPVDIADEPTEVSEGDPEAAPAASEFRVDATYRTPRYNQNAIELHTTIIHTGSTAVVTHNAFPEQFSFPARHLYSAATYRLGQTVVPLDNSTRRRRTASSGAAS